MPDFDMQIVLDRLKEIQQSVNDLRDEFHGFVGRVAKLEQWQLGRREDEARLNHLEATSNQLKGALSMIKVSAAIVTLLIGLGEFLLHRGEAHAAPAVEATSVVPRGGH